MATRQEQIAEVLDGLRKGSPEVIGAALVNNSGFVISAVAPSEVDENLVGGMAAALLGVAERILDELMRAKMEQAYIRSEKGYIIVNAVGDTSVLVLLVTRDAKLGLIFLEVERLVPELLKLL